MSNRNCPACGSVEFTTTEETRQIGALNGPVVTYTEIVDTCHCCKESGDFDCVNGPRIHEALRQSRVGLAHEVVELMKALYRINLPNFDRMLGLRQRTSRKWLDGDCPEVAGTLLALLKAQPSLILKSEELLSAGFGAGRESTSRS